MALAIDILGMQHTYPDTFIVAREQIRGFARSVQNDDDSFFQDEAAAKLGYDGVLAPLTFVSIIANRVQQHFFMTVDLGVETMQIVQVDQQFLYHRPIKVGDELQAVMHIHSVHERFGADIVVTRNVLIDVETGETVMEAFTTLMGQQGEESSKIKFDKTTGQVSRVAD